MADESLLHVDPDPAWYEELMRLKDQGRVSMTPAKGLLRSNVATGVAQELANPPELNWNEAEYLELQKDRGKNLDRFLRFDFNKMQPGETFTKATWGNLPANRKRLKGADGVRRLEPLTKPESGPAILYHGSPKFEGETFDLSKLQKRDRGFWGKGVYLSANTRNAKKYADPNEMFAYYNVASRDQDKNAPEVIPLYANIQNPINLDQITIEDLNNVKGGLGRLATQSVVPLAQNTQIAFENALRSIDDISKSHRQNRGGVAQVLRHLEDITGFNMSDVFQASGYDATIVGAGNEVVIYDPRRLKSIFNQGSFNPLVDDLQSNLGLGSNYARRA